MRSESESVGESDLVQADGPGHVGGTELAPAWQVVQAGERGGFAKEFAEPMLVLLSKIVGKEIESVSQNKKRVR